MQVSTRRMLSWLSALDRFVAPFQPRVLLGYGNENHSLDRPEMAVYGNSERNRQFFGSLKEAVSFRSTVDRHAECRQVLRICARIGGGLVKRTASNKVILPLSTF